MRIALASLTPGGAALERRIIAALECGGGRTFAVFAKDGGLLKDWVRQEFAAADALVFVGATGIAVRVIAGLLHGKDKDPAVLVLDEKGEFVIPLLSGHVGGANRLARELAARLGARAVITTATDLNNVFAVDEWAVANGCVIADPRRIKGISAALLRGEQVGVHSDFPVIGELPGGLVADAGPQAGVCISLDAGKNPFAATLHLIPGIAILGAGCRKGASSGEFERFALDVLAGAGVSVKALRTVASIDMKKKEPCLLAFAAKYGLEFAVFSAAELNNVPGAFASSGFVREKTGTDNVCERAATAAGGERLLVRKTARNGMTLALAVPDWSCIFA